MPLELEVPARRVKADTNVGAPGQEHDKFFSAEVSVCGPQPEPQCQRSATINTEPNLQSMVESPEVPEYARRASSYTGAVRTVSRWSCGVLVGSCHMLYGVTLFRIGVLIRCQSG